MVKKKKKKNQEVYEKEEIIHCNTWKYIILIFNLVLTLLEYKDFLYVSKDEYFTSVGIDNLFQAKQPKQLL